MATYAIGDIHGGLKALKTVFDHGRFNKEDRFVFLGDYVDRGPDSKGVFNWLIKNKNNYNFEFILGNHEIMMQTARNSQKRLVEWLNCGGKNTLESYKISNHPNWVSKINQTHWEFLDSCKPYLELDKFIFVHAGLEQGKELDEQNTHHLFWKKYETPEMYNQKKIVICGHTARKNGLIADFGHTICIDTYAHGGMWLTCLNVETREYLKANNEGQVESGKI